MYYYYLKNHHADDRGIYVSSAMGPEKLKCVLLYLQAKVNMDISENICLDTEDTVQLLENHYGLLRHTVVDSGKPMEEVDLLQLWNENIETVDSIVVNPDYQNPNLEDEILALLTKDAKWFLFINAAALLPKWAEDIPLEPLTLQVTHNGVLIQGLSLLESAEREKMTGFYPASKFYDSNSLFFSFEDFPPYQYSFSWNGRHISVMQVKESDDSATEIVKQMNIGYYLSSTEMDLPLETLKALHLLKKKMRLG